ncbi:hypothetical protein EDD18DRAFT_1345608 [Armillaria luteobubalina]|uniref:Uncharacterized protein n=1 Tax=Armillaria luteobubalina TaxID=153913 RepID=A0AA39QI80_9AGAR|nr:hypothetical protein EDD18DRAFT_1345608 [Armillaria luteobubalina]
MSSIFLPPRGQCIKVTDNLQLCQCPSFASTLDQHICGRCGHGIHAHRDYVSMFVHHCPVMNCAAYFPKTAQVQACMCSASLIEHVPVVNVHRSLIALPYGADTPPSNVTTFTGDATNILFTPLPMPATSTNDAPSHSYDEIVAPAPQPVFQTAFMSQVDVHSHLEVVNSHIVHHQNNSSGIIHNIPDSDARFHEDHSSTYVPEHGAEAWADHRSS